MITRDLCTGFFFTNIWLELRSDVVTKFEKAVTDARKNSLFQGLGYPII
jgi:hypothetical protein